MGRGVLGGSGQGEEGVSASAACVGVPGKSGGAAGGLIQGVTRPDVICQLPRTTLAASGREQREVEGV